jgi:transcriptional regulator with XRE-family HTH domain
MTDTEELKMLIRKSGLTLEAIASEMKISKTSLSYKINNKRDFKSKEIKKLQIILKLSNSKRDSIFFKLE